MVDRHLASGGVPIARSELEAPIHERHVSGGRRHVNRVRFERHTGLDLSHPHPCRSGEDAGKHALVLGIQVLDEHEAHPCIRRQMSEQLCEGLETARRCADPDNRKVFCFGLRGLPAGAALRDGRRTGLFSLSLRPAPPRSRFLARSFPESRRRCFSCHGSIPQA